MCDTIQYTDPYSCTSALNNAVASKCWYMPPYGFDMEKNSLMDDERKYKASEPQKAHPKSELFLCRKMVVQ